MLFSLVEGRGGTKKAWRAREIQSCCQHNLSVAFSEHPLCFLAISGPALSVGEYGTYLFFFFVRIVTGEDSDGGNHPPTPLLRIVTIVFLIQFNLLRMDGKQQSRFPWVWELVKEKPTWAPGSRRALITGITGQDGSYLSELLLELV